MEWSAHPPLEGGGGVSILLNNNIDFYSIRRKNGIRALVVNYYYLKTFEIKFQSTKLYLTPFKVIL